MRDPWGGAPSLMQIATLARIGRGRQLVSVETAHDPTDQIAAVERSEVDPGTRGYRLECTDELGKVALRSATKLFCGFDGDRDKAQRIARPPLSDDRQVGRNDRGDLGVAAGRLVIGE